MKFPCPARMLVFTAFVLHLYSPEAFPDTVSYDLQLNNLEQYRAQSLARVTLTDTAGGVDFLIEALVPGSRLQKFGFNFLDNNQPAGFSVSNLPGGWHASVHINHETGFSNFGKFDVSIKTTGYTNRLSSLAFSVIGGSIANYAALSFGNGEESLFSVHVTNLNATGITGYAGGGITAAVPLPSVAVLFPSGLVALAFRMRKSKSI